MRIPTLIRVVAMCGVGMFIAVPAAAQSRLWAKGGLSLASASFDPSLTKELVDNEGFAAARSVTLTEAVIGAAVTQQIREGLDLQIEGLFTRIGGGFEVDFTGSSDTSRITVRLTSIEIPVLVSIGVGPSRKVHVQAGMFVDLKLKQTETDTFTVGGVTQSHDYTGSDSVNFKAASFGVAVGADAAISDRLRVGGRFNLGLNNILDDPGSAFKTIKSRAISVFAMFGL